MKICLLTSSRADYGIYQPLIKKLKADDFFELRVIVFGTHLSHDYGYTVNQIQEDGIDISFFVDTMPDDDSPYAIAMAMGKTMINFSDVWRNNYYDLVIALGDRYEMFAACASSVPFGLNIAHIHGGETTLGAFDDAFRHSITHMANIHFTTTEIYRKRVINLKGSDRYVYNVGALSIDNLSSMNLLSKESFKQCYGIDMNLPSILITFHPETVGFKKNREYIIELTSALKKITDYQLIITMPNSDTMGKMIREQLNEFVNKSSNAVLVESFGTLGYLSCMKHCSFMLGNTSSGFVEAAFFPTHVINLGERQSGRILTANIISCKIEKNEILKSVKNIEQSKLPDKINIYGNGDAALQIISNLKSIYS